MMSSDEVWRKVEAEIAGDWDRSNGHGVILGRCLIRPPELRQYRLLHWPPKELEGWTVDGRRRVEIQYSVVHLWLVLEEKPETKRGYKIVYDEKADQFGLAAYSVSPVPGDIFDGCYGSFLETLEAM